MSEVRSMPRPQAIVAGECASFILYPEKRLVVLTLGDRITLQLLEEYSSLLRRDPRFELTFSEIADMTAVQEIALEADEMMRMADQVDPFSPDSKRAFVVKTPTQAHAARMHKILLTHRHFEIFRSLQEAERWIQA